MTAAPSQPAPACDSPFFSGDNNPKCLGIETLRKLKKKSKNFLTDVYKLTIGAHKYS
jgi:hypothetical protein